MRAVNLLPQAPARGQGLRGPATVSALAAAAVPIVAVSLLVIGYTREQAIVSSTSTELAGVQAQVAKLTPAVKTPEPSVGGIVTERTARLAALNDVLGKQVAWDTALNELARALPSNVWLTDLTASAPVAADSTAAAPAAGSTPPATLATNFTIDAYTYTEDDVAAALARIQLVPDLTNVTLGSSEQATIANRTLVQFQVAATVVAPQQTTQGQP